MNIVTFDHDDTRAGVEILSDMIELAMPCQVVPGLIQGKSRDVITVCLYRGTRWLGTVTTSLTAWLSVQAGATQ